jgi:hypothetical protein
LIAKIVWAIAMAISAMGTPAPGGVHEESFTAGATYLFVDADGSPSLWQETNGHAGLQTASTRTAAGRVPADSRILL